MANFKIMFILLLVLLLMYLCGQCFNVLTGKAGDNFNYVIHFWVA